MKKILVILGLCLISVFSLVGCSEKNEKGQRVYRVYDVTLVRVASDYGYDILVHEETKVMYIQYRDGYQAGISVMLDQDGKPLLWQGE
jgi:hypothetical protein